MSSNTPTPTPPTSLTPSSTPTSTPLPAGSLDYGVIGDDISVGSNIMYRGAVKGNDGLLYLIPYDSDNVTVTDLSDESQVQYDITSLDNSTFKKYVGGAIAPNGKIYAGPHNASAPLIIDTTQDPPTFAEVTGYTPGYNLQCRGPAYYNNRVYIPSYTGGSIWAVVNTDTDSKEASIVWATPPRTDAIYTTRTSYATEAGGTALKFYDALLGGVAGNNGKIYGMPYGASRINIVDT